MGLRSTKLITYHDGNCNNTTASYGTFYLFLSNTASNAGWGIGKEYIIIWR